MAESLSDKSKNMYRFTLAGLTAAAIALPALGCGGDEGSSTINACPTGYLKGAHELKSVPEAQQALQEGVTKLRTDVYSSANAHNINGNNVYIPGISSSFRGAALAIFNRVSGSNMLNLTGETKVDDVSEAFCHDPKRDESVYMSPAADAVIGELAAVNIAVKIPAN